MSETPAEIRSAAPLIGQHTNEILQEFGFETSEVDGFNQRKATAQARVDLATSSSR
jgi:crotonobetainyl-CoA:carnitine CoA-transferase CaiB-like acyl-CoA transferase